MAGSILIHVNSWRGYVRIIGVNLNIKIIFLLVTMIILYTRVINQTLQVAKRSPVKRD